MIRAVPLPGVGKDCSGCNRSAKENRSALIVVRHIGIEATRWCGDGLFLSPVRAIPGPRVAENRCGKLAGRFYDTDATKEYDFAAGRIEGHGGAFARWRTR